MDCKKTAEAIKLCGSTPKVDKCKKCVYWSGGDMSKCIPRMTEDAAAAITALDEARENENEACAKWEGLYRMALERAEKAEEELFRMKSILSFPKLYEREGDIYPIKNTTKKQVYKAMLDAQKEAGIYGRGFYKFIEEEKMK